MLDKVHQFQFMGTKSSLSFNLWGIQFHLMGIPHKVRKIKKKQNMTTTKRCRTIFRAISDYKLEKPSMTLIKTASFNIWVQFTIYRFNYFSKTLKSGFYIFNNLICQYIRVRQVIQISKAFIFYPGNIKVCFIS